MDGGTNPWAFPIRSARILANDRRKLGSALADSGRFNEAEGSRQDDLGHT